jgi:hypothetical protein
VRCECGEGLFDGFADRREEFRAEGVRTLEFAVDARESALEKRDACTFLVGNIRINILDAELGKVDQVFDGIRCFAEFFCRTREKLLNWTEKVRFEMVLSEANGGNIDFVRINLRACRTFSHRYDVGKCPGQFEDILMGIFQPVCQIKRPLNIELK